MSAKSENIKKRFFLIFLVLPLVLIIIFTASIIYINFISNNSKLKDIAYEEVTTPSNTKDTNPITDLPNQSEPVFKIALLIPGSSPFWNETINFMQEAANDLEIELSVLNADSSHLRMFEQLESVVSGEKKVYAAVFQNFKKMAPKLISLADRNEVYTILFNSPIPPEEGIGKPRELYPFWLGEILPNDTSTSTVLTNILIEEAQKKKLIAEDGKIHVMGISGRIADTASIERVNGLLTSISDRSDVVLDQVVNTDWSIEEGKLKFKALMNRYPETNIVWTANYKIAQGVIDGMKELDISPGKDILIVTFDIVPNILNLIKRGEIVATAGGHSIESAWALVLLYDHYHGVDFASESLEMKTPMSIVTKDNLDLFLKQITPNNLSTNNLKKIDFTIYSKFIHPELDSYNFDFASILVQLD